MRLSLGFILLAILASVCWAHYETDSMHRVPSFVTKKLRVTSDREDAEFWMKNAQEKLKSKFAAPRVEHEAKNIIFFLGDGFSLPTVTATRILKGQRAGSTYGGEEAELHFESYPSLGISKTYCTNSQVADSACSATAYLGGVKTNYGITGVSSAVTRGKCEDQMNEANHVSSILAWAQAAGKSTGVVTTTSITDASPSGNYGHIAERGWNDDVDVTNDGYDPNTCEDLAKQLILNNPGKNINVILGGGREHFLRTTDADPEQGVGRRQDGKNLVEMWSADKQGRNAEYSYISHRDQLLALNTTRLDYVLGLFAKSDIAYNDSALAQGDPALHEMTKVAVEILSKNPNGFFLFVEGGRIDHGHHSTNAQRALIEALEFEKAIEYADGVTSDDDTLITVTADHSHVMSISGYPVRGNPLFGLAELSDVDNLPYSTLHYANGPGYRHPSTDGGARPDLTNEKFDDIDYKQPTTLPESSETHGGDDVLIFTKGPFAHLLSGVVEQSYIPHALAYAACIGNGAKFCDR
jgi:alkaline phosphatase